MALAVLQLNSFNYVVRDTAACGVKALKMKLLRTYNSDGNALCRRIADVGVTLRHERAYVEGFCKKREGRDDPGSIKVRSEHSGSSWIIHWDTYGLHICVCIINAFVHSSLKKKSPLSRHRNRDNLYLKVLAIPAEIKSRETKDCSESHLFKVGYNDKDGRSIFTFTLIFVPNESIRSYMLDMRFSLSALRIFIS